MQHWFSKNVLCPWGNVSFRAGDAIVLEDVSKLPDAFCWQCTNHIQVVRGKICIWFPSPVVTALEMGQVSDLCMHTYTVRSARAQMFRKPPGI